MREDQVRTAAEAAVQQRWPALTDVKATHWVSEFVEGWLVVVAAREGGNACERLAHVTDDYGVQTFKDVQEMALGLRGQRLPTTSTAALGQAVNLYFRLMRSLADYLRNLKDWQLVFAIVALATLAGLIPVTVVGLISGEARAVIITSGICMGFGILVTALCVIVSAMLEHSIRFEKMLKKASKEWVADVGLDRLKWDRLIGHHNNCKEVEDYTRGRIAEFYGAPRPPGTNGEVDLSELLKGMSAKFRLHQSAGGGLISRNVSNGQEEAVTRQLFNDLLYLLVKLPVA
jgi:hypothetical protein